MSKHLPTISEALCQIRSGALSPVDLVEACLAAIDRFENQLRAWVVVDAEGARRQARQLEGRLASGDAAGLLFGIPIGIKDIVDVEGLPTEAGSPLRKGMVAGRDAPLVARLRSEGAIILGKTVTTEFACFDPSPTRNPWNAARTPGGSSSGSAAAVASGMCMAAVGSQTGGSIIRPASYCGVAGLKPRWGSVSLQGVVPISFHLDHAGPIARSVDDLAAMFLAMRDKRQAEEPLTPMPPAHWRVVTLEDFFNEADEAAAGATRGAVEVLRSAGAAVMSASLPVPLADVLQAHRRIMAAEAAHYHRPMFTAHRDKYSPHVSALVEEGLKMAAVDYAEALAVQRAFREALAKTFDSLTILAAPATVSEAPGLETTGDPRLNSAWSFAGCAALTLPCGISSDRLPLGLQLATAERDELFLLAAARWAEDVLDPAQRAM